MEYVLQHLPDSMRLLTYSLRFLSIKMATAMAPDLLQNLKHQNKTGYRSLPPIMQHLQLAIEAIAPSFSVFKNADPRSLQDNLGPLAILINDVLQTANEYSIHGLEEILSNGVSKLVPYN